MVPRIDNRLYTNLILTVIALVLIAGAARDYGVNFLGDAQAQIRRNVPDLGQTSTGVVIDSSIPQTQDVAVAAATSEVAASNRDIAAAIRELAEAVHTGTDGMKSALSAKASSSSTAPAASSSAASSERPTIQVAP